MAAVIGIRTPFDAHRWEHISIVDRYERFGRFRYCVLLALEYRWMFESVNSIQSVRNLFGSVGRARKFDTKRAQAVFTNPRQVRIDITHRQCVVEGSFRRLEPM